MKKITYKDKQYSIPESWEDVTIKMQIDYEALVKELGDELQLIALISAYTSIPIGLIKEGKTPEIVYIMDAMDFINEQYIPMPIEEFEYKGQSYYIKDSLLKNEFQDYLSLMHIIKNNEKAPTNGIPRMVAVLAKRKGETLDSFELDEREKEFYDLPLTTGLDMSAFFLVNSEQSKINLVLSSKGFQEELLRMKFQSLRNSIRKWRVLNGKSLLIRLQTFLLLIYTKYIEKQLVRFFNT